MLEILIIVIPVIFALFLLLTSSTTLAKYPSPPFTSTSPFMGFDSHRYLEKIRERQKLEEQERRQKMSPEKLAKVIKEDEERSRAAKLELERIAQNAQLFFEAWSKTFCSAEQVVSNITRNMAAYNAARS